MKNPFEWMPNTIYKFAHDQLDKAMEQVNDYKDATASHKTMHDLLDESLEATKNLKAHEFLADLSDLPTFVEFVEINKFNT